MVTETGLEPANLLRVEQALYQLSYSVMEPGSWFRDQRHPARSDLRLELPATRWYCVGESNPSSQVENLLS